MKLNVLEPQPNFSYEGMIEYPTFETRSIAPISDHHIEEMDTNFIESIESYTIPIFNDALVPPLIDPLSMRYVDSYCSYILPPSSTITSSFTANPSSFGFPE
jgi:hypothetical protein